MQDLWILNLIYTVFNPIIKKSQSGILELNLDIMFLLPEITIIVTLIDILLYNVFQEYFFNIL